MHTAATKRIFSLIKSGERKKQQIENQISQMEKKKQHDERELKADEAIAANSRNNNNLDTTLALKEVYQDKKVVMDDDHEIAELKRKLADADKRLAQMNHWTEQSEFDDERKQQEAINLAKQELDAI